MAIASLITSTGYGSSQSESREFVRIAFDHHSGIAWADTSTRDSLSIALERVMALRAFVPRPQAARRSSTSRSNFTVRR